MGAGGGGGAEGGRNRKAGDTEHIRSILQNVSIHLLHIPYISGTLFFIITVRNNPIVTTDALLFRGVTDNLSSLQFNATQRTKQKGAQH